MERRRKNLSTINFAVEMPQSLLSLSLSSLSLEQSQKGVVGTITFLGTSACMVWVGWGDLVECSDESNVNVNVNVNVNDEQSGSASAVRSSSCGMPPMGPMVVAMPRTKYAGMSGTDEAPCSQLIGGDNEEEVMMGNSMACRLTKKIGMPVFVSCSLESGNAATRGDSSGPMQMGDLEGNAFGDMGSLEFTQHACSLAEKEIGRIISERKNMNTLLV